MQNKLILIFIFLIFGSLTAQAQQIKWLNNYDEAAAFARASGKPLLLDFSADWCAPCQLMEKDFWTRADVIEAAKKFVAVKVDYNESAGLTGRYGVESIPNIIATDAWGVELVAHRGFSMRSAETIIDKLKSVPDDFTEIKAANDALIKNQNDLAALYKIAGFYKKRTYYLPMVEFYGRVYPLETDAAKREDVLLNISFGNVRAGQPDKAITAFENFRKEFPRSSQIDAAIYGEIFALTQKGKTADANRLFEQLKTNFPKSSYINLAEKALKQFDDK